jgi:hypothetical protein
LGHEISDIEQTFDEYIDDMMSDDVRTQFEKQLKEDPSLRQKFEVFQKSRHALFELGHKNDANRLKDRVAQTIHAKSGGRFFGKKTLGDKIPVGWIIAVILVVLVLIALTSTHSEFGGL